MRDDETVLIVLKLKGAVVEDSHAVSVASGSGVEVACETVIEKSVL